jgi:uncharacterized protein YaaR (DUF327 family)
MDKVGGPFGVPPNAPFLPSRDESRRPKKTEAKPNSGFLGLLRTRELDAPSIGSSAAGAPNPSEAELEALLDEVHGVGQELARYPSPENVLAYKKTVGRFIQLIVSGSLELTEVEGRMRKDMKKPKYALLQVINEKLDKLGAYVLSNQKDHLEILRKVDELNGLLVDLRH